MTPFIRGVQNWDPPDFRITFVQVNDLLYIT